MRVRRTRFNDFDPIVDTERRPGKKSTDTIVCFNDFDPIVDTESGVPSYVDAVMFAVSTTSIR